MAAARWRSWDADLFDGCTGYVYPEDATGLEPQPVGKDRRFGHLKLSAIKLPKAALKLIGRSDQGDASCGRGRSLRSRALACEKPFRRPGEKGKGDGINLGQKFLGSEYLYEESFPSLGSRKPRENMATAVFQSKKSTNKLPHWPMCGNPANIAQKTNLPSHPVLPASRESPKHEISTSHLGKSQADKEILIGSHKWMKPHKDKPGFWVAKTEHVVPAKLQNTRQQTSESSIKPNPLNQPPKFPPQENSTKNSSFSINQSNPRGVKTKSYDITEKPCSPKSCEKTNCKNKEQNCNLPNVFSDQIEEYKTKCSLPNPFQRSAPEATDNLPKSENSKSSFDDRSVVEPFTGECHLDDKSKTENLARLPDALTTTEIVSYVSENWELKNGSELVQDESAIDHKTLAPCKEGNEKNKLEVAIQSESSTDHVDIATSSEQQDIITSMDNVAAKPENVISVQEPLGTDNMKEVTILKPDIGEAMVSKEHYDYKAKSLSIRSNIECSLLTNGSEDLMNEQYPSVIESASYDHSKALPCDGNQEFGMSEETHSKSSFGAETHHVEECIVDHVLISSQSTCLENQNLFDDLNGKQDAFNTYEDKAKDLLHEDLNNQLQDGHSVKLMSDQDVDLDDLLENTNNQNLPHFTSDSSYSNHQEIFNKTEFLPDGNSVTTGKLIDEKSDVNQQQYLSTVLASTCGSNVASWGLENVFEWSATCVVTDDDTEDHDKTTLSTPFHCSGFSEQISPELERNLENSNTKKQETCERTFFSPTNDQESEENPGLNSANNFEDMMSSNKVTGNSGSTKNGDTSKFGSTLTTKLTDIANGIIKSMWPMTGPSTSTVDFQGPMSNVEDRMTTKAGKASEFDDLLLTISSENTSGIEDKITIMADNVAESKEELITSTENVSETEDKLTAEPESIPRIAGTLTTKPEDQLTISPENTSEVKDQLTTKAENICESLDQLLTITPRLVAQDNCETTNVSLTTKESSDNVVNFNVNDEVDCTSNHKQFNDMEHLLQTNTTESMMEQSQIQNQTEEDFDIELYDKPCDVLLKNLPSSFTEEDILEIIEPYGTAMTITFTQDNTTKTCVIRMSDSICAELLVVSLDGLDIDGNRMQTELCI